MKDKKIKRPSCLKNSQTFKEGRVSHTNFAGYQKFVEENPLEKNTEYYLVDDQSNNTD